MASSAAACSSSVNGSSSRGASNRSAQSGVAGTELRRDRHGEQQGLLVLLGDRLAVFRHRRQVQRDRLLHPLDALLDGLSLGDHPRQGRHGHRVAPLLGVGVENDGVGAAHLIPTYSTYTNSSSSMPAWSSMVASVFGLRISPASTGTVTRPGRFAWLRLTCDPA